MNFVFVAVPRFLNLGMESILSKSVTVPECPLDQFQLCYSSKGVAENMPWCNQDLPQATLKGPDFNLGTVLLQTNHIIENCQDAVLIANLDDGNFLSFIIFVAFFCNFQNTSTSFIP